MVLLSEDEKLLERPLRNEDGEALEKLGEGRREVDENRLALGLRVVLREHLGDGAHSTLHVSTREQKGHAGVVVDLAQVLDRTLLEAQHRHRPLHDLRAVPHEGLEVAEDQLEVHAAEAADQHRPPVQVQAAEEVVPPEVLRQLGPLELVDVAVRAEDERLHEALGGLCEVELLRAEELQQHDVRGLALLLQVDAPDGLLLQPPGRLRGLARPRNDVGHFGAELG
mmetsp:Transcript_124821/g.364566  ORF Transcript_124821/g.364566 Transcript_124821/m.364566 type:complete len:225 (-) Transcript_124821:143-817(-)